MVVLVQPRKNCEIADLLPSNLHRSSFVHSLIQAYGIQKCGKLKTKPARLADKRELLLYHSKDYIEFLENAELIEQEESSSESEEQISDYGLAYDCPIFEHVWEYNLEVVGGTLTAIDELLNNENMQIALNWEGGRHHARRRQASGFCYVNDIVIGLLHIQKKKLFDRVMYLDLDVHHGDAVQNAFLYSQSVLTVSIHNHDGVFFFPGTGGLEDVDGFGKNYGRGYSLNIPLNSNLTDASFITAFDGIVPTLVADYDPEMIVVQCGCDGLNGDPTNAWNLSENSYIHVVRFLKQCFIAKSINKKLLVLGGGGYANTNAAKCWTTLTALLADYELNPETGTIPEHKFAEHYGPYFDLKIPPNPLKIDANSPEYLENVIDRVLSIWDNRVEMV